MSFPENSFDCVYAIEATVHAPKLEMVYGEIFRVLKPGGMLLLYDARPLIGAAAEFLRSSGVSSIERTGQIMSVLSARLPIGSTAVVCEPS